MVQPKRQQQAPQPRLPPNGVVSHLHGDGQPLHVGASATLRMDPKRSSSLKMAHSDEPVALGGSPYVHPGHPQLQRQNSWDPPVPPAHPHHPESSLGPPAADSNGAPQGPPELTEAEQKAQEDALVDRASELKKQRAILSQAFDRPNPEPIRCLDQQAAMLKEMRFMFLDFSQERLWKLAAARALAHEAVERRPLLRATSCAAAQEVAAACAAEAKLQRQMSGRAAGPSGVNQNSHRLPPGAKRSYAVASSLCWAPNDPERFCAVFAAHVQELADNRFIKQEQAIRDYDDEYEVARKAVLEASLLAQGQADGATLASIAELDEQPANKKGRKMKGRLPKHLDDFAGVTPVAASTQLPPSPTRASLPARSNRSAGTPVPEPMAVEEEDLPLPLRRTNRKKRQRDYDDDDYEEPRTRDKRRGPPEPVRAGRPPPPANLRDRNRRAAARTSSQTFPGSQGPARKAVVVPPWSQAEDALLSAIVFEFGANWSLVSDIMSSTTEILGVYRRPDSCQAHFRQNLGVEEHKVLTAKQEHELALKRLDKGQARQVLLRALPVQEAILRQSQKTCLTVMLAHKHKHATEEARAREGSRMRGEAHPSHVQVQQAALSNAGGRFMGPTELADSVEAQHAVQHAAAQQAQQAQQQAAQAAAAAQQAATSGPPHQQHPQNMTSSQPMQHHPSQSLPVGAGRPPLPPQQPPSQQQQQQQQQQPHMQPPMGPPRPMGSLTPPPVGPLQLPGGPHQLPAGQQQLPGGAHQLPGGPHHLAGAPHHAPTGHSQGPGSMSPHLPHPMGPPGSQMHPPGGQMQPPVGTQNLPHHLQAPQQQQSLPMTSHPGSHEASMQPQQQQQQASMPASMAFSMGMNLSMSGLNPGGIPGMPGGIPGRPPMPTLPQGMNPSSGLPAMPSIPGASFPLPRGPTGVPPRPAGGYLPNPSLPTSGMPGQPVGLPGQPRPPVASAPQLSSAQIQHILSSGKLPDGRELSPQIKQALMNKLRLGPLPAASMQPQAAANPASGQGAGGPPRGMQQPTAGAPRPGQMLPGQLPQGLARGSLPQGLPPNTSQGLRPPMSGAQTSSYPARPPGVSMGLPGFPPGIPPGMMSGIPSMPPQMQAQMAQMRPNMLASYTPQPTPALSGAPQRPPGGQ